MSSKVVENWPDFTKTPSLLSENNAKSIIELAVEGIVHIALLGSKWVVL